MFRHIDERERECIQVFVKFVELKLIYEREKIVVNDVIRG